ncbi:hypothetical protein AB0F64_03665 [Streptomyces sp. NPDC026294]|uniref:hypothetical protein n=1 Tax=Streptomyces sp. NPDC026294 TaxID=3155362 RepID=UPI00340C090E
MTQPAPVPRAVPRPFRPRLLDVYCCIGGAARTVTEVRRLRRTQGWHVRPRGRDICPGCWKDGQR